MDLVAWARRHRSREDSGNVLSELKERPAESVARRTGFPLPFVEGVQSFYDDLHSDPRKPHLCTGTACTFAPAHILPAGTSEVHCMGQCYAPPAGRHRTPPPIPWRTIVTPPIVLRGLLAVGGPSARAEYDLPSGEEILDAVIASGLCGRGGAAYPTGAKWKAARDTPAPERFVVANGDEGDPGTYVDRLLLEECPHLVIAGMLACARAIGAGRGIIFIRGEYPDAPGKVRAAIGEARAAGLLGGFDITVLTGAGSYVAGEETALLAAIEGRRAEPRPKPPYPAERGLEGLPTVVQNVETLAVVPWVVRHRRRAGTKVVCLSGAVAHPGAVEIALGTPLGEVVERGGGGAAPGRRIKMALVGGPMGRVLPLSAFDTPLAYETLPGLGHGGVVLLDETVSARRLFEHLASFARSESCGSCTPCRAGTWQLDRMRDEASLLRLLRTVETGSLCGFGQGVPRPIRDLLTHYRQEMFAC